MIPAFLLAQDIVVSWVTAWMVPFEATYGTIESERERQRTTVSNDREGGLRMKPQRLPASPSSISRSERALPAPNSKEICKSRGFEGHGVVSRLRRHLSWARQEPDPSKE